MWWLTQLARTLRLKMGQAVAFCRQRCGKNLPDPRVNLGAWGEDVAMHFLKRKGYRVLQQGFSVPQGEIDIVALDRDTIVFVEVKTWRGIPYGGPSDAVDEKKQSRITKAALCYLKRRGLLHHPARFDVVQIIFSERDSQPEVRHFIAAFEAVGRFQLYS